MTDVIDDSYKQIAIEAVVALGAKICGIDLIIPDKDVKGTRDSLTYGIIEANFNPAMHMHVYPYAGQGRRLTMDVLKLLYPEVVHRIPPKIHNRFLAVFFIKTFSWCTQ